MRPLLPALIAVAALVAAPSAALAKGAVDARVCGAAGCEATGQQAALSLFPHGTDGQPPATATAFATIELDLLSGPNGKTTELAYDYLPSLGLARPHSKRFFEVAWIRLEPASRRSLDAALSGVALRPATQLARAAGLPLPQPPPQPAGGDDGPAWWAIAGAALAVLALLGFLVAHYARTSALNARPRASKSAN